ncbi:MAG TPA: beta-ketoacyl synthase N-terminal-like domain-containing protein, partial [bacterium]
MKRRVVITGLGCVSPLGNTARDSWESAAAGRSGIGRITRFDPTPFRSHMAGEVKNFDPTGVLTKTEIATLDRFAQYALVAAIEAVGDAGVEVTDALTPRAGVALGVGLGGLASIERFHALRWEHGPGALPSHAMHAVLGQSAADHIAARFRLGGYSVSTSSACSSSNHAIGNAARLIERGDATVMLAGGTEATVTPLGIGGFAAMHALSTRNDDPARASRPYDAERDGFVLGEGAAVLVLEEQEHALARGARIYAELAGYGYSGDAFHMTTPSMDGPYRAMTMALRDAQANPEDVDYVNTHGT